MRKRHWKKKSRRRFEKVRRPVKKWGFPDLSILCGDSSSGIYDTPMRGR